MQIPQNKAFNRLTRFLAVSLLAALPALSQSSSEDYIVSFQRGATEQGRADAVRAAGASLRFDYSAINAAAVTVPNANALAALGRNPNVYRIVPDRVVTKTVRQEGRGNGKGQGGGNQDPPEEEPTDPGGGSSGQVIPPGIQRVGVPTENSTGEGVGILIIDGGIDWTHPDLNVSTDRFDAFGGDCMDVDGHGTHVAGTAAALDNSIDVLGVAPGATLYCGKGLDDTGSGTDSSVLAVLHWALQSGASMNPPISVINMSLGRAASDDDSAWQQLIDQLAGAGIIVVTSAGNDPTKEVTDMIPAGLQNVIAVASTTALAGRNNCKRARSLTSLSDMASYFTTDGAFAAGVGVTISAPGETQENITKGCFIEAVGILSLAVGGGSTDTLQGAPVVGTSMASPHVAGVAARWLEGGNTGVGAFRDYLQNSSGADLRHTVPYDSISSSYTFDGKREGIAQAP